MGSRPFNESIGSILERVLRRPEADDEGDFISPGGVPINDLPGGDQVKQREFQKAGIVNPPKPPGPQIDSTAKFTSDALFRVGDPQDGLRQVKVKTPNGDEFEFIGDSPQQALPAPIDAQPRSGDVSPITPVSRNPQGLPPNQQAASQPQQQGGGNFFGSPAFGSLAGQIAQAVTPSDSVFHALGAVGQSNAEGRAFNSYLSELRKVGDPTKVQLDQNVTGALTPELRTQAENQVLAERLQAVREDYLGDLGSQARATARGIAPFEQKFDHEVNKILLGKPTDSNFRLETVRQGDQIGYGVINQETGEFTRLGIGTESQGGDGGASAAVNNFRIYNASKEEAAQELMGEFGEDISISKDDEGFVNVTFNSQEAQNAYQRRLKEKINFQQGTGRINDPLFMNYIFDGNLFQQQSQQAGQTGQVTGVSNTLPDGAQVPPGVTIVGDDGNGNPILQNRQGERMVYINGELHEVAQ